MTNQQPNPYTYPCFVLKETVTDNQVTASERHTFGDLQDAYLWAYRDTRQTFPDRIGEGIQGTWDYVSFRKLRSWLEDDAISGYVIFRDTYDEHTMLEYLIYYDIPSNELYPNGIPSNGILTQNATGQPPQIAHANPLPQNPIQIPILPLNTLTNINSNLSILTNDQLVMINNLTNSLLARYNTIH